MVICLKYKQFLNYIANNLSNKTVYSPSSQLTELRNLRADIVREMQQIHCYSTYTNSSYFDD